MTTTVDLDTLTQPFPAEALKWRWADKNQTRKLTYVEGHVYIRRVNEATGNNWSMEVRDITSRDFGGGQLVMARVSVTIPEHGTREGIGVQAVHERGGEDLVKGALTDAVKNALKYFGVGLELYGPDYEAGEVAAASQPSRPQPRDSAPAAARPAPVAQTGGITEPQQKFVRGLMSEHGVSDELMHTMILVDYNAEHLRELTKEQASAYIKALQSLPIPEQQGIKQETQRGFEHNQYPAPEEPEWVRADAGNDRYTA